MFHFFPSDDAFEQNVKYIRELTLRHQSRLNIVVVIDGSARGANSALIRPDGLFAYTNDQGEHRVDLERLSQVYIWFE